MTSEPSTCRAIGNVASRATTIFGSFSTSPACSGFEQLSDNSEWVEQIRRVYDDDIDSVDLLIGLLRDEIREVSPGLFLGIVFFRPLKTINFVLQFGAQ